jgi:hypothetical protein
MRNTKSTPTLSAFSPSLSLCTHSSPVREREGEKEKEGGGKENCPELLFLFLKGMTGALAPFSYLSLSVSVSLSLSLTSVFVYGAPCSPVREKERERERAESVGML